MKTQALYRTDASGRQEIDWQMVASTAARKGELVEEKRSARGVIRHFLYRGRLYFVEYQQVERTNVLALVKGGPVSI